MKLIRDKLALIPYPDRTVILVSVDTQKSLIFDKVLEEAHELFNAKSDDHIVRELGDLLDVIDTLKKLHQISDDKLSEYRRKKNEISGGFEVGYVLL